MYQMSASTRGINGRSISLITYTVSVMGRVEYKYSCHCILIPYILPTFTPDMTTQFTTLTQFLRDLRPRNQLILIAVTSAALGIPVLRIAIEDYRGYIALGPGGPPHNVIGWFGQILLKPFKKEPFHTSCYDEKSFQKAGPNGSVAFLKEEDVPAREAPRPTVGSWTAPSRQLTDLASKDIIDVCCAANYIR